MRTSWSPFALLNILTLATLLHTPSLSKEQAPLPLLRPAGQKHRRPRRLHDLRQRLFLFLCRLEQWPFLEPPPSSLSMSTGSQSSTSLPLLTTSVDNGENSSDNKQPNTSATLNSSQTGAIETAPKKSINTFGQRTSIYHGVRRVRQKQISYQILEFPQLSEERILCIGFNSKRPVLKWENNMAWPGKLTLTDKAVYFEVAWEALSRVIISIPKEVLPSYIKLVRDAVSTSRDKERRKKKGGPILIPGFCLPKALQTILPIFLQSDNSNVERSGAAQGLSEQKNIVDKSRQNGSTGVGVLGLIEGGSTSSEIHIF
ncbi:Protein ILITYHIA [Glycine max]|nr:Protein ILITYHIA [Glycine max]